MVGGQVNIYIYIFGTKTWHDSHWSTFVQAGSLPISGGQTRTDFKKSVPIVTIYVSAHTIRTNRERPHLIRSVRLVLLTDCSSAFVFVVLQNVAEWSDCVNGSGAAGQLRERHGGRGEQQTMEHDNQAEALVIRPWVIQFRPQSIPITRKRWRLAAWCTCLP